MSGTLKVRVDAVITGPIADGRASDATMEWAERVTGRLGERAVELLRDFPMDKSGRSTGAFGERLSAERVSSTETRVKGPQERGVVWSPWLEGTTKRNESTGFKGYRLFSKTRRQLNDEATEIGQQVLDEVLPEMGGE